MLFYVLVICVAIMSGAADACPGKMSPAESYKPFPSDLVFSPTDTTIKLPVNTAFQLALPSNPTTGYSWAFFKDLSSNSIVELTACYYIRSNQHNPDSKPLVGSGGIEYWELKTKSSGEQDIELEYSRPWLRKSNPEDGRQADLTFHISVEEQ